MISSPAARRTEQLRSACRRPRLGEPARSAAMLLATYGALLVIGGATLSSLAAMVAA